LKPRKCKVCKEPFKPFNSLAKVCSPHCALKLVRLNNEKAIKKDMRERKKKLKTKSQWAKEAQTIFNQYIRERDKNENCISCQKPPRKRNAGHYKSVGAFPELRFHPLNCHLQCEHCNTYKSGNQSEYRLCLISRIGASSVDWLESYHQPQKLTIEDLIEIKQYYKEQLKRLKL